MLNVYLDRQAPLGSNKEQKPNFKCFKLFLEWLVSCYTDIA